jgi:ribosomal protein L11 methylase PrmA
MSEVTKIAIFRVRARDAEVVSDKIWEVEGVLGIQESPLSGAFFEVPKDFEILEFGSEAAKKAASWLESESFRGGEDLLLKVHLDPSRQDLTETLIKFLQSQGTSAVFVEEQSQAHGDWIAAYQASEKGASFGDGFWIGPPWATPPLGTRAFFVEPGMAFGTGGHPTTQLLFERIFAWARAGYRPQTILDLGSGSGILAVALSAAFPGLRIVAADLDEACEVEIRKTFRLNQMDQSLPEIRVGQGGTAQSLAKQGFVFDAVVSNIYGEILAEISPQIAKLLKPGGRWLSSGILQGPAEETFLASVEKSGSNKSPFERTWRHFRNARQDDLIPGTGLKIVEETWVAYEYVLSQ